MHWDDHVRALDKDMNRYYTRSMGVRWKSGHLKSGTCRHRVSFFFLFMYRGCLRLSKVVQGCVGVCS